MFGVLCSLNFRECVRVVGHFPSCSWNLGNLFLNFGEFDRKFQGQFVLFFLLECGGFMIQFH